MELPQNDNPPRVLILPEGASPESRIYTLAHPRTLTPSHYLVDPENGTYELTCVSPSRSASQSWLIGRHLKVLNQQKSASVGVAPRTEEKKNLMSHDAKDRPMSEGFTIKNAELLIATPIDPLFLLLPSFILQSSSKSPASERLFLSVDDLWERLSEVSRHFEKVTGYEPVRSKMEQRLKAVCDSVDAGDEKMYRLSDEKLLHELMQKAMAIVAQGLPASMEERFVRKALETPVMFVKHEESSAPHGRMSPNVEATAVSNILETVDTQVSVSSADSTASALSATTELTIPDDNNLETSASGLYYLMRLRTALSYIIANYVPSAIASSLNTLISSGKSQVDFKTLDEHLANIAKMHADALASRSLGDFSRKRSMYDDDDSAETRAEKKRKQEEDERKKKATESRGVKDLKKVDTTGMKKMSYFFGKATATKKT